MILTAIRNQASEIRRTRDTLAQTQRTGRIAYLWQR
jgi:hypothetical protein